MAPTQITGDEGLVPCFSYSGWRAENPVVRAWETNRYLGDAECVPFELSWRAFAQLRFSAGRLVQVIRA